MSNGSNTTQPTLVERLRELLPATPQISTQVDVAPPEGQPRRLESGQALVTRPLEKETPVVQRLVEAGTILDHIVFDPFGTLVGIVRSTADDIRTVSHIVPDELDHPAIQAKLAEMGFVPENLRPLAELNARFLLVQERTAARDRLAAFGTSMLVGGIAGSILRNVGVTSQVVLGAGEAGAFGATFGVLDPEIDVITSTLVAVPLGTVGGLVGAQLSKVLKARGVKPHLEVPEIEPNARNLSRVGETRKGAPFIEKEPGLGGKMTEGAVKASERKAQPGLLEKGAAETAARDVQTLAETEARRIVRGGSVSASEASILSKVSVGAKEARPKVFGEFYTKYLDDLHPINLAVKDLLLGLGEPKAKLPPGVRLGGIEDPYVLARLSRGSVGKANAFLETGPLDFATLQPVGPGLKQIVEPVVAAGKLESLRAYLPARRALELEQRGIETPFTDILDAAKKTVADVDPVVARATAQLDNYQSALLKYMQDSGILSGEQVKLMQEANRAYVPFYKFIEGRIEGPPPPSGPRVSGRRFANLRPGLRRIRGGKVLPVVDPLESIVRNTYAFVRLADRQAVSDALVRLAERYKNLMGEEPTHIIARTKPGVRPIELAPAEMKKSHKNLMELLEVSGVAEKLGREELSAFSNDAMTIFRPRERLPEGVIWVMREGKRQFYEVDSPLYRALLDLDREMLPQVMGLLSFPARTLRAGATLSPSFIARNPLRDQFTAAVFSRYGFKPIVDLGRGIFHVAQRDKLYEQFRRSGGEHAALVRTTGKERAALQRTFDRVIVDNGVLAQAWRTARSPRGWLEGLRVLSEGFEEATRSQEFARALAATGDPRLAGFAAREVTLDFARMGTNIRVLNQIIPFFNANVQGIDKLQRAFRENPVRATALATAYITVPTMTIYFLNQYFKNADGEILYDELSTARRDFFWNVPIIRWNGDTGKAEHTGEFISIPKPFELGLIFGSYAEHTLDWLKTHDREAFDQLAQNTLDAFKPTVLPTAIAPFIEAKTGYSFWLDRPLIPEGQKDLLVEAQESAWNTEVSRLVGRALNVSPRLVDNTIRGYTGGLGMGAAKSVDGLLEALGVTEARAQTSVAEKVPLVGPLLSAFYTREPTVSSRSVERFYRRWDEVNAVYRTILSYGRQGKGDDVTRLVNGMRTELAAYRLYYDGAQAISALQQAIRTVRSNTEVPREQREQQLLLLGRAVRTIAKNTNDAYGLLQQALEAPIQAPIPARQGTSRVPVTADSISGLLRMPRP